MDRLQEDIPNPKTISIHPVSKNNGVTLDGLVILEGFRNIAPTIYLNHYYQAYESGCPFQDIYMEILHSYRTIRPSDNVDISFFTDYRKTRTRIVYRLINAEKNSSMLQDIPHFPFLDLAVVFCVLLRSDKIGGSGTILIHNSHLDYWDVTGEDLLSAAEKNTPLLLQSDLRSIGDVISDLQKQQGILTGTDGSKPKADEDPLPMYVLSNSRNLYGAGCILYHDLLKKYAQNMHSDFYILPSSIHEVILVPTQDSLAYDTMSEMVREVNASSLLPDEILSDHAYYYSRNTGKIQMK